MRQLSQQGLSLIELLVVITLMGILFTLGTLGFSAMKANAQIDAQAKEIYADLMKVRSDALFTKSDRSVKLTSATRLSVYATPDGSGPAIQQKNYPSEHPILSNDSEVAAFDASGVAKFPKAYCVGPTGNGAGVDSVVISSTSIMLGKLSGGDCTSANIEPK